MSRRRRTGTLSRVLTFLLASFANLTLGGRHTPLEPLANERPTPVMSKHWPVMVTVRTAVVVVALVGAFLVAGTFASPQEAFARWYM